MPNKLKMLDQPVALTVADLARPRAVEEDRHRLARIQCLWVELQAARKDPVKYEAVAERIRREADAFRRMPARPRLMH